MSSYGIIGVNTDSTKVIRDMQQFKRVSVHDKYKKNMSPFRNVKVYPTVADLTLNMDAPRTVASFINPSDYGYENTMDQLIEWCDKEDTIVNINTEKFTTSQIYADKCCSKGIHYISAAISNNLVIVDGLDKIVDAQELFFRTFSKKLVHIGVEPGTAHLVKMVHEATECALYQLYADVYGYFNQDLHVIDVLNDARKTDMNGYILDTSIRRMYDAHEFDDIAPENERSKWCVTRGVETGVCGPILHSAVNARSMSRDVKFMNTKQVFNKFIDNLVVIQAMRFVYAMIYIEATRVCPVLKNCIESSVLDCDMYKTENLYDIAEANAHYAKTFCIQCMNADIPCPTVQMALCEYQYWSQTKTSMNFIASLRV